MKTKEDELITEIIKEEMKNQSTTGRQLADLLEVSESMVCLLLQSRRKWTPKYMDRLKEKKFISNDQYYTINKYAAISAGYNV